MTSPFLQPAWTIEEAVLLVEASENIASKMCDVDLEVKRLSERLRGGVGLTGLTVSSRYRNEDDVRNNLRSMSSMLKMIGLIEEEYIQGSTLGAVALYYRNYPDRYAQLLEKANHLYPDLKEKSQVESKIKADGINVDVLDLSEVEKRESEVVPDGFIDIVEVSSIPNNQSGNNRLDSEIVIKAVQESDEDSNQIDTASEGVSIYQSPRRRRPRISDRKTSEDDRLGFSSVFPSFPSKNVSIVQLSNVNSKADPVSTSSLLVQNIEEKTHVNYSQSDKKVETKTELSSNENRNNTINAKLANVRDILVSRFRKGYRIGSSLDRKRFREYYKSRFNKSVGASEEVVEGYIRSLGFEYDGKVYISDVVVSDDVRHNICGFITDILTSQRDYVYFEHIYENFKDEIESTIVDKVMLRLYLKDLKISNWIFREDYIASSFEVKVSIKDELLRYMLEASDVRDLEQLKRDLAFLPFEDLEYEWMHNKETLISNGPKEKFHIGIFYCPKETIEAIASLIRSGLKDVSFMTYEGLFDDIRRNMPELIANNSHISELGFRNALSRLLSGDFSFKNNVISRLRDSYEGPDAILAFCRERGCFTFEEIDSLATEIKCAVNFYLDKIYEYSIRIDDFNFVPKSRINFDVKETDGVLDLFVKGLFTPIRDIITFDAFPSCGEYSWNKWILENYVLTSSSKYCLIRPKYLSKETVTGAIVKRGGLIKTYDDLIIQAIANSEIPIEEEAANEYLYEMGIINAKRKNGQVKNSLIKAREYRNRINKNKN